jgi:hypothetical protein
MPTEMTARMKQALTISAPLSAIDVTCGRTVKSGGRNRDGASRRQQAGEEVDDLLSEPTDQAVHQPVGHGDQPPRTPCNTRKTTGDNTASGRTGRRG